MKRSVFASIALTFAASLAATTTMAANKIPSNDGRIEVGYLTCKMTDSSNIIVVSEQQYSCIFDGDSLVDGKYTLTVKKYGLDMSITENEELRWAVLAPSKMDFNGVIDGSYAGIAADVAIGYGIGAKALIGGGDKSIALQPVSVTKGEGLGAALGIETATLTFEGVTG